MQVLFSKILGTFCPQRKSSVPGPFAKASAAQCVPHGMAELLHQIKYTDLIGLGQVS